MNIIAWVIFGALAGWIASMIAGTNRQQGCIMDIIVGVVGAFIGGAIVNFITGGSFTTGFNLISLIVAILGAVILLFIWRAIFNRRAV